MTWTAVIVPCLGLSLSEKQISGPQRSWTYFHLLAGMLPVENCKLTAGFISG